jgi:hypothetical protein
LVRIPLFIVPLFENWFEKSWSSSMAERARELDREEVKRGEKLEGAEEETWIGADGEGVVEGEGEET